MRDEKKSRKFVDKDSGLLFYQLGVELFEEGKYGRALEYLIGAYIKGYNKTGIINDIYNCYVLPNETEFRDTYESMLVQSEFSKEYPAYEELTLDFIPYEENKYYIYDKESEKVEGIFDLTDFDVEDCTMSLEDPFSDIVFSFDWNYKILQKKVQGKKRQCYFIAESYNRAMSFFKIPGFQKHIKGEFVFNGLEGFQEFFHSNTSCYLPRIIISSDRESQEIKKIIDIEHRYRCTKEGRSHENVLLSICVPSFDRGHLALKRVNHLRESLLDAEIEIVVSNSGSQYYKEEYNQIGQTSDSRLTYYAFDENKGPVYNWHKTAELSHGKFFMLVSDEDEVILENIVYYLSILRNYPDIGVIRSSTAVMYNNPNHAYFKAGMPALKAFFLTNSYITGIIYNTEKFLDNNFLSLEDKYKDNEGYFTYSHLWWDSIMVMKYDFCYDNIPLCIEGENILGEQYEQYKKSGSDFVKFVDAFDNGIVYPIYARYESRLKQHMGFITLINLLELPTIKDYYILYSRLCRKTAHLIDIYIKDCKSYNLNYDLNYSKMGREYVICCKEGIKKLNRQDLELDNILYDMIGIEGDKIASYQS